MSDPKARRSHIQDYARGAIRMLILAFFAGLVVFLLSSPWDTGKRDKIKSELTFLGYDVDSFTISGQQATANLPYDGQSCTVIFRIVGDQLRLAQVGTQPADQRPVHLTLPTVDVLQADLAEHGCK